MKITRQHGSRMHYCRNRHPLGCFRCMSYVSRIRSPSRIRLQHLSFHPSETVFLFIITSKRLCIDSAELYKQTGDIKLNLASQVFKRPCFLCCRRSASQQDIGINWRTRSSCRVLQKHMTKRSAIDALSPIIPRSLHHEGLCFPMSFTRNLKLRLQNARYSYLRTF